MASYLKHDKIPTGGEYDYYGGRYAVFEDMITIYSVLGDEAFVLAKINTFNKNVNCLSWSHPSLGTYISAGCESTVCIWKEISQNNWELVAKYMDHLDIITSISWSSENLGLNLLAGSNDRYFSLSSCKADQNWKHLSFLSHNSGITSVSWLNHEKLKSFVTSAENIKIWEFQDLKFENSVTIERKLLHVKACTFGKIIAGCSDSGVFLYHMENEWQEFKVENAKGKYLQWSHLGNILVVMDDDCMHVIRRVPADLPTWIVVQKIGQDGSVSLA